MILLFPKPELNMQTNTHYQSDIASRISHLSIQLHRAAPSDNTLLFNQIIDCLPTNGRPGIVRVCDRLTSREIFGSWQSIQICPVSDQSRCTLVDRCMSPLTIEFRVPACCRLVGSIGCLWWQQSSFSFLFANHQQIFQPPMWSSVETQKFFSTWAR